MSIKSWRPLALGCAIAVLSGCSWIGLGKIDESYRDAEVGKELQIPADLDSPQRQEAMRVPNISGTATEVSDKPVGSLPVDADDPQSRLKMRMTPDEAFAKVLEALEQAKIAKVGDVDREARRVAVGFDVTEERKRWWWKDGVRTDTLIRVVHVVDDSVGSRVIVEEEDSELRIDDEYAQRVLSALRDRVTWE